MVVPIHRPEPTGNDEVLREIAELRAVVLDLRETIVRLQFPQKEFYTTAEAAAILGRRPFTVREWCRHGRVNAVKADCGRGATEEWRISRAELDRIRNDGLLPEK
ncbi:MAG: helix-turn-helix domain-containing protein [Gemmataceae bacterium]|nr:helix-turn-helix domain-containing protein [Gemmataceae bacterium]